MSRADGEIGLVGRLVVVAAGLMLMGGFRSDSVVGWMSGVLGVVLAAAAVGVVELAMAVWYRARRRRLMRN